MGTQVLEMTKHRYETCKRMYAGLVLTSDGLTNVLGGRCDS